jgi:hypothetical protein
MVKASLLQIVVIVRIRELAFIPVVASQFLSKRFLPIQSPWEQHKPPNPLNGVN